MQITILWPILHQSIFSRHSKTRALRKTRKLPTLEHSGLVALSRLWFAEVIRRGVFDQLADIRGHAMGYDTGTDRDSGVASSLRVLLSQFNNSRRNGLFQEIQRLGTDGLWDSDTDTPPQRTTATNDDPTHNAVRKHRQTELN